MPRRPSPSTRFPRLAPPPAPPAPRPTATAGDGGLVERLKFMFATGVEGSYPISTGGRRVDQFEATGHYDRWEQDLQLVRDLGIKFLRWGPPAYRVMRGPGDYDWDFTDRVMAGMADRGIEPIVDLLHFGLPDWLGDFQNPDWPKHFADYAAAFARRFPHVRFYTPVNEIYVTAQFSAAFGWWNERLKDDAAFVRNVKHSVRASHLAMRAILEQRPDAVFVFSESTEYVHPGHPSLVDRAKFLNERRFLSLDLLFGHDVSSAAYRYLMLGMTPDEYDGFMAQSDLKSHCVMGTDYYVTNEHVLHPGGRSTNIEDVYGYYVITRQYYDRYRVPVMHTETNRVAGLATKWLWKEWMNLLRLREDGVPVIGFTWFGLTDMVDWDSALTKARGHVCPVGLYTLNRRPRKVAREYRRLIQEYGELPISRSKFPALAA